MWDTLVKVMGDTGVLTQADANLMAMYCEAYSDWRDAKDAIAGTGPILIDDETGRAYRNPYCAILREAVAQMASLGASLGLDPAARTRLKVTANKPAGIMCRDRNESKLNPPPWANQPDGTPPGETA